MNKSFVLLTLLTVLFFGACVDREFDEPEFDFQDPDLEVTTTIAALKSTHVNGQYEVMSGNQVISGVVVANDKSGNYYETIVMADETGGIEIKIDRRSLFNIFPVGRRVFVKLDGLILGDYNELIQIGYSGAEDGFIGIPGEAMNDYVIGGSLNNSFQVDTLSIDQLSESYVSMPVVLKDVQFPNEELGNTYADGLYKLTVNRIIEDCSGREVILRTSGYASFANKTLPEGKGTITAILSRYRDDFQMYLRDTLDIDFTGQRCGQDPGEIKFDKDFEDGTIFSGGWTTQVVTGSADWEPYIFDNEWFARISNYNGSSNQESEAWLISPEIDLAAFQNPVLTFRTACNYAGPDLEIYVRSGYDGSSSPDVNEWRELAAPLSNGSWNWVQSGEISMADFSNEKVHVAFRYLGTNSNGKTWEVDDIAMREGQGGTNLVVIFEDGFDNGLDAWSSYNVLGDQVWEHSTQYGNPGDCARVSGYDGQSFANEDWLISPEMNLTNAVSGVLTFETAKNYTGNDLEVYLSSAYDGTGNPNDFSWNKIQPALSSGAWDWTPSGDIDLADYIGGKLYFAFKFTSTNSASATWEVDNVEVSVEQ
jgi:hypothetical protein